jgi:UDP-N-acetylmuramate: L-alanyl-gamma-D-glutamyl-meso-diaminopimelate ligase
MVEDESPAIPGDSRIKVQMLAQNVHFIGIAGAGMSAVAKLLRDSGVSVTGSDESVYPPISDFLAAEGLPYVVGYSPANIPPQVDIIVIGKNARLVSETNAEVRAAFNSGKTILSFPEVLTRLAEGRETAVVAGSYGKSTCAALLSHALTEGGVDPSFFIGAIPLTPPTSSRLGQGKIFVLEGDEYPSSNTDPRAKFLHYRPKSLLLAPLAHDHVNVYPTIEDYLRPFAQLADMPQHMIACTEGPLSAPFLESLSRPVITYGFAKGDWTAANIAWGATTHFDLMHRGAKVMGLSTSQLGEHSVQNIVGVGAFVLSQGLLDPEAFAQGVATFKGVRRRLDLKSEKTAIPIFEGFGSSYEKARSAIAAVKLHFPQRRLVVAFEPHAFSWRNREALAWYDDAFKGAETVFVYEPATQGAATHSQVTQQEITARIAASGIKAIALPHVDPAPVIGETLRADDVVLLLTSGNLGGLIETLPAFAERVFPA